MREYRFVNLLLAGLLAASAAASAATPILVRDFATGAAPSGPDPGQLTRFGSLLAMAAEDPAHGVEPFVFDPGDAALRRLADLLPGPAGSRPRFFTPLGERLVFVADDGYRHLIYRYDPGAAGHEVETLAGIAGYPYASAVLDGRAYFFADDFSVGQLVIYESDGSTAGTSRLGDFCPYPYVCYSGPEPVFPFGGALYFSFSGAFYRFTPGSGPVRIGEAGRATEYAALDESRFVMRACEGVCRLWVSDGSAAGTFPLEAAGGTLTEDPRDLVSFGGRVYAVNGDLRVVTTDGRIAGTRLEPGFPAKVSRLLGKLADRLLYSVELLPPYELRAATAAGVHQVLAQGGGSFSRGGLFGNRMVIYGSDHVIWLSDGSAAGTQPAGNVLGTGSGSELGGYFYFPGLGGGQRALFRLGLLAHAHLAAAVPEWPLGSYPRSFAAAGGIVAAALDTGTLAPAEVPEFFGLHRVDPISLALARADFRSFLPLAVAGDSLYAALQPTSGLVAVNAASVDPLPSLLVASPAATEDGRLVFSDADPGQALWQSDGTFAGTLPLFDLAPGWTPPVCVTFPCPEAQLPAAITPAGDRVFFLADTRPDLPGTELWVLPAGAAESRHLADLPEVEPLPRLAVLAGGRVAYAVPDVGEPEVGTRFWVSDGTEAGTRNFLTLPGILVEPRLAGLGARLLIASRHGHDLRVADPDSGLVAYLAAADQIGDFTVVGDLAFFRAADGEEGAELWRSDGTQGGTFAIALRPGLESSLAPDAAIEPLGDGRVVFAASDGQSGNELWISDGSAAGTRRLADLAAGPPSANPREYARALDRLFFQADDGEKGAELWMLDLPAAKPPCPPEKLCLLAGRFEAEVTATVGNRTFNGQRAMASSEAGIFTFFGPDNWELMVKLLDGCHLNQHVWAFAAGATDVAFELKIRDRATGTVKTYQHPAGAPAAPILDLEAMAVCGVPAGEPAYAPSLPIPPLASRCADDPLALCLGAEGRFRVKATWRTQDATGSAQALPYGSRDSGIFWFFNSSNWELVVKVLDGCALNQHHWVYAAGTTDAGWKLEIEDRLTGETKTYENPAGHPSITVTDSLALGGCP